MATPTAPTKESILLEAFRRCGFGAPTAAQLLRAEDEWLEDAKREITDEKRWHNLEETVVMIPQAYIQAYPVPSPLFRILRIRCYDGTPTGTSQAGAAFTITLAAGTGSSVLAGRKIFLTGGTGAAQVNRILSVSGDVATVACQWVSNPDDTTTYIVADSERELIGPERGLSRIGTGQGRPLAWEEYEQTLRVWPVPDLSTYALELDGVIDISLLDETDGRAVKLLREWRTFLTYAVMAKISEDNDDQQNADKYEQKAQMAKLRVMRADSRRVQAMRPAGLRSPGGLPARR